MYTLRMLGGLCIVDSYAREVDALLRQPKHVALLCYLALPRPGVWHRRDSILGTFWSEHDQSKARSSLRSALYTLRRHLPEGAIISRGDDELSLDLTQFTTDVAAMMDDVAAAQYESALAHYRGELLPGVFVADAPEFDKWLATERTRARKLACVTAAQLAAQLDTPDTIAVAITAARRGAELDPDDEAATRRWIALLDRSGDRAQAFAVYERFRDHLSEAFGVRPSAETVALLDEVRTRREPAAFKVVPSAPNARTSVGYAQNGVEIVRDCTALEVNDTASPSTPTLLTQPVSRKRWKWFAGAATAFTAAVLLYANAKRMTDVERIAGSAQRLIVLPMRNETGSDSLDYVATGIAAGIAKRLEAIGRIKVISAARSEWTDSLQRDFKTLSRAYQSRALVSSVLRRVGDSLEVKVIMADSIKTHDITVRRFKLDGIRDAESWLAASIAVELFHIAMTPAARRSTAPDANESYRLTLQGLDLILRGTDAGFDRNFDPTLIRARELLTEAIRLDNTNAMAHSALSSSWAIPLGGDAVPFDYGYRRAVKAAEDALLLDSLQGSALANMAFLVALKVGNLQRGLVLMRQAEQAEPNNPEVFVIKSTMFRYAHQYPEARDAIRVARLLDPLASAHLAREAALEICAGNINAALALYREELSMDASNQIALRGLTRTFALQGNFSHAAAMMERMKLAVDDPELTRLLEATRTREDYWRIQHGFGQERLARLQKQQTGVDRVSDMQLMQAYFQSGDSAAGFRLLDRMNSASTPALYRLSCLPDFDEYRETPRFKAAAARTGALGNQ